jgi:argininosuccinate synthase
VLIVEDPNTAPPKNMWKMTVDPIDAPDKPYHFSIDFEKGIPVKVTTEDGTVATESVELYKLLNKIGHDGKKLLHLSTTHLPTTPMQC